MIESIFAAVLFWVGYLVGQATGENTGYHKGWSDKETGSQYKPPR